MSNPETPLPQPTQPEPQPETTARSRPGNGLLATAILVAGIGGGLLAWHPWDEAPLPPPPKDPGRITIQKVGEQREATAYDEARPVYCITNETGGLYCLVMPNRYTHLQEERP